MRVYAKLNLFLKVKGLDKNDRHILETLMASVGIYDTVAVSKRSDGKIFVEMPLKISEKNNALIAAEDLQKRHGFGGVDIYIEKGIPLKSGMGGSSADTAAAVYGLKKLYGSFDGDFSVYGDDTPFMLSGGVMEYPSFLDKKDRDRLFKVLSGYGLVVFKPKGGLLTKDVFRKYDETSGSANKTANIKSLVDAILNDDKRAIEANVFNDLFFAASKIEPSLIDIRDNIASRGSFACGMTGSGNAFFGLYGDEREAAAAKDAFKFFDGEVFLCGFKGRGIEEV
jgi:4-diphosphocytidyl-2-C-methyl-D-erythritol kinase